jgi:hypothetical protein
MTYLHFHDGEPVPYEETCPNEECETARLENRVPPIEYTPAADLDA